MEQNSKSQILNSKQYSNPNPQIASQSPSALRDLGFGICLGFRVWDLGFHFFSVSSVPLWLIEK